MKFGHTTASLLIAKLYASSRQNSFARALHEYGRLVRTIYLCRYVAEEELRRQLNKGESLHALRRDLFFAQGHVRRRHLDDQVDRALCLTLVTNAAVLWTTTYLADALDALGADGYPVTDEDAAHPHTRPARPQLLEVMAIGAQRVRRARSLRQVIQEPPDGHNRFAIVIQQVDAPNHATFLILDDPHVQTIRTVVLG